MRIIQKEIGGVRVYRVKGEINIDTVSRMKTVFKEIIEENLRNVVLNFKGVEYIDSLGMASLIEFLKDLNRTKSVVFLSNLSPKLASIFSITGMEKLFKAYNTETAALEKLASIKER